MTRTDTITSARALVPFFLATGDPCRWADVALRLMDYATTAESFDPRVADETVRLLRMKVETRGQA